MSHIEHPFSKIFAILTKQYISIVNTQLKDLPIDRYFYPLYLIAKANGKIGQKELAEQLFADKVTIVRIIDYYEKNGMVERVVSADDRRCHLLFITKKAEPYIEQIELVLTQTNELFLSFIDEPFREQFKSQLNQLTHNVQQIPGDRYDFLFDKITPTNENE